ncbi:uroporphyrinogen decarboxylase [Radiomyces spectabilis]|uniref:uroporphyrinogen decarboxylase n=1 Tax=Radiomyces spectabilis TaxID=64574 RepID=UPI00221F55D0|nr:uroporphyrinogen decarboxylase [Radiomyces spectabilis]KAI8384551.1 uroporphyrinogen decarboxylase [Radiomyces spectabilis]
MSATNFPPLKNDLILRASRGEKVERVPIWIMRQAGRYLPEFQEVRKHHGFFEICRTPELACQLTLQPIDRYGSLLDASIIFSDILVIPQALGMEVQMVEGRGPVFPEPLVHPKDVARLREHVNVDQELGYVYKAITLTRHKLDGRVPLFGFTGAPWTLMAYMIEGGGSKTLSKAKTWLWKFPEETHELLQRITGVTVEFLVGQVRAGAQMLQIFDSWAGELSPHDFRTYSLPYIKQIATEVKERLARENLEVVPMTIFAKGAWYALADLTNIGYEVVSLDWTIDPEYARHATKDQVVLQGNMDPSVLFAGHDAIRETATRMVQAFGRDGKHIANLGHGILPTVDPEALRTYLETVQRVSAEIRED